MNNPKLIETRECFFVTARFKKLSEEKGLVGKPTKRFDRESAKAFVEERVLLSIRNTNNESIAAKSIRNINTAKKETTVVRSCRGGGCFSELSKQT